MPILSIDQIQDGMELAADVLDRNGQPLLRAGITITSRERRRFRMWGIDELAVVGTDVVDPVPEPTIDPAVLERLRPSVERLFKHTNVDHPLNAMLMEDCLVRLAHGRASGE